MTAAVKVEKINFKGWPNSYKMSNGEIELVVTSDVGPRVIHFGFVGGQNVFKEFADEVGKSGESEWKSRGGHRIWVGPEYVPLTYAADNGPVEIQVQGNTIIATPAAEGPVRLQKQMIIKMAETGTRVEVINRIKNLNFMPAEFAVWNLTVMAPGGVGAFGFPPRGTHPENLEPSNVLTMWPFTDLSDKRWVFLKKYLLLKQDSTATSPQKIGMYNPKTWGAYFLNGDVFIKRYTPDPKKKHPDMGVSYETFTNKEMLEMETMGPLEKVLPNEWIELTETWSLTKGVKVSAWTDAELDRVLLPLL